MNINIKKCSTLILGLLISLSTSNSYSVVGSSSSFAAAPPATSPPTPLVMLTMSNDHQLHYKAYTDWDDLDNNGIPETTYDNSFEYYGYFDPQKCYIYDTTDNRFEPNAIASNHYCTSSWSGNFLNWASMTRIDIIRKVLYGGFRSSDTTTETILERAFLPTDAHSFAKYYGGSDIDQLTPFNVTNITLCNTTYTSSGGTAGESQNVTAPPLIRVVEGDFRYWAANERWQCTFNNERGNNGSGSNSTGSETSDPAPGDGLGSVDYVARILVCDPALLGNEECRTYTSSGSTILKPSGLLQQYGEDGQIHFGLLTGSYEKNLSGGVVRKNISNFSSEVNADGTFANVSGIVSTLDSLRISRYFYGTANNHGLYNTTDNCTFGLSTFAEGRCSNWGNPISEMYLEAVRYFAGESANTSFAAPNDNTYINNLASAVWSDPLNADNYCASCNIIVLNASEVSYDNNSLDMSGLPSGGTSTATTLTNAVGLLEGINGNQYLVGENGIDNNQLCTAKTITNLGDVRGTCPGSPRLSGTYNIAGISYWAKTQDIRTDLTADQLITTYSVALAPALPKITIPVPGSTNEITILPACRNSRPNPDGNCAIVDFKIIAQDIAAGTGSLYVNWEDSEQGGDYDQDMKGVINYAIAGTQITVTTDVDAQSTPYEMGFGYVISGTTDDGFHVHSGINNFNFTDPGRTGCVNCQSGDAATAEIYTIGTSSASFLEDPLFYAAKYGGFKDFNNNNVPDAGEWDIRDLDGNLGSDGIPDSFFPVSNPTQLNASLQAVFNAILNRVASGTAAAVVSNSTSGVGALYQALYQPLSRQGADAVSWTGYLHGIFIDDKSQLREDNHSSGTRGQLDACSVDRIIEITFDNVDKATKVTRFSCDTQGEKTTAIETVNLSELQTIWDARDELNELSDVLTQRSYTANASGGRHIFTFIDADLNGEVGSTEVVDFTPSQLGSTATDPNRYRLLNADTPAEADNIINYIRGQEIAGYRSRTIDYDGDGNQEVWRLGDIIHSTPAIVGEPNDGYEKLYNDDSYRAYKISKQDRRQVVYVGANDGMIHAFNAGFFNSSTYAFETSSGSLTSHELGEELWAYVPYNLLPHLRWLTEEDYPHVYYVDGPPITFDAKIFTPDTTYINGWGTILAVTMRLGGGTLAIDHDGNSATPDQSFRSAVILLDVTDPESAPKLLAEISHPNLGLTTSTPAVMYDRSGGNNDWYLVFGSGPTDVTSATSTQNARIFKYNLSSGTFVSGVAPLDLGVTNSYVSSISTVDWNFDYESDAAYFGLTGGTASPFNGRLMRLNESNNATTLINPGQPFGTAPLPIRNQQEHWVYSGTGRLFNDSDKPDTTQQSFYGIKEMLDTNGEVDFSQTISTSSLTDVSNIAVFLDGSTDDTNYPTWGSLQAHIETTSGWYRDFENPSVDPSTRNVTNSVGFGPLVLFTDYTPDLNSCESEGFSFLNALHIQTGTAFPFDVIGLSTNVNASNVQEVNYKISLGEGLASSPVIHTGSAGQSSVLGQLSTGGIFNIKLALPTSTGERKSWREIQL